MGRLGAILGRIGTVLDRLGAILGHLEALLDSPEAQEAEFVDFPYVLLGFWAPGAGSPPWVDGCGVAPVGGLGGET